MERCSSDRTWTISNFLLKATPPPKYVVTDIVVLTVGSINRFVRQMYRRLVILPSRGTPNLTVPDKITFHIYRMEIVSRTPVSIVAYLSTVEKGLTYLLGT